MFNGSYGAGSAYNAKVPESISLNVAVVSDLHAAGNLNRRASLVLAKLFNGISKSTDTLDAIVIPGDLTDNGTRDEYRCLAALIKSNNRAEKLITALGNHDVRGDMFAEDYDLNMSNYYNFCSLLGVKTGKPYWFKKVNGYYFIVLGSEADLNARTYISDTQLRWLDLRLTSAERTGKPAFIVCHQVIDHTNNVDNLWKFDGSIGEQSDAVRDVIRKHTENGLRVLYLSGHLHQPFGENSFEQPFPNLYCLNLPSVQFNEAFGQGCMLEAYPDYVLIRARNFITGEWLPNEWTVPLR